jgi:membrane protein required for colicin V production
VNLLDLILVVPLCWCIYKGFKRGIIFELAMLVGIVAGCYLAIHLAKAVSGIIGIKGEVSVLVAFLIIFVAVIVGAFFLGKCIENLVKLVKAGLLNKLLGAVLGMLKCVCILSVLTSLILMADPHGHIITQNTREGSVLFNPINKVGTALTAQLKTYVAQKRAEKC